MKKFTSIILSMLFIISLVGCGKKEKYEIEILVPTGSTETFVYSEEEIRPIRNKITIWSGAGLGDTEVILQPVNENVETGYVGEYLTHGVPVKFDTGNVKDEWFKIGVSVQNDSDRGPIAVSVEVEGVEVRITEKAEIESSEEVVVGDDLIPMVMVNGELYLDTGKESTLEARCGMMDGEITSTVDRTELPTKDNESNFGTGYGYQYGSHEGLIEIYMNDKWWIFATEKTLASSELMIDPVAPVNLKNIFTGEEAPLTVNEDIRVLQSSLSSDSWNIEGTTDCLSNIEIIINGETYKYHSDCGTFNDKVKQQYLSLDNATKEKINAILAEHISLVSEEIPIE